MQLKSVAAAVRRGRVQIKSSKETAVALFLSGPAGYQIKQAGKAACLVIFLTVPNL